MKFQPNMVGPYKLLGQKYNHPIIEWESNSYVAPTGFIPGLQVAPDDGVTYVTIDETSAPTSAPLWRAMWFNTDHKQIPHLMVDIWAPTHPRQGAGIRLEDRNAVVAIRDELTKWLERNP